MEVGTTSSTALGMLSNALSHVRVTATFPVNRGLGVDRTSLAGRRLHRSPVPKTKDLSHMQEQPRWRVLELDSGHHYLVGGSLGTKRSIPSYASSRSNILSRLRATESTLSSRITEIYKLDDELSNWSRKLPSVLRLTPESIALMPQDWLPKILLMNIIYHQCFCVLHASIIPLFCWDHGGDDWLSARQHSAQVAYEHADTVSDLLRATISTYNRLSAMPSFIAYAAYCGCAIQLPFLWSSNRDIKEKAKANVKTNIEMMHIVGFHWKMAALLVSDHKPL